jgi:hypothetical protein
MPTESEQMGTLPEPRDSKLGFTSRRRRLRNRWNIHMRKDERARDKLERRADAAPLRPIIES